MRYEAYTLFGVTLLVFAVFRKLDFRSWIEGVFGGEEIPDRKQFSTRGSSRVEGVATRVISLRNDSKELYDMCSLCQKSVDQSDLLLRCNRCRSVFHEHHLKKPDTLHILDNVEAGACPLCETGNIEDMAHYVIAQWTKVDQR